MTSRRRRLNLNSRGPLCRAVAVTVGGVLAALAAVAVGGLASCAPPPPEARETELERSVAALVGPSLRFPETAVYRELRVSERDGLTTVCGRVEARNRLQVAGSSRFIAAGDSALLEVESNRPSFEAAWFTLCTGPGEAAGLRGAGL